MTTPETAITFPTLALSSGATRVIVTTLPASLMDTIPADWFAPMLGRVNVVGVPSPLEPPAAGENAVIMSEPPRNRLPGAGDKNACMVGGNRSVRGIHTHVGDADVGITRDVDLQRRTGVKGRIGADAKDGMEIRGVGRSRVRGNDDRAVDLTTGEFEQSSQRNRRHPAHTSETHRHPEEEILFQVIRTESIIVTIVKRTR